MTVRTDPPPVRGLPAVTPARVLAVLVAVAAAAVLFFGLRWALALGDDSLELGAARDTVLLDARQVAINLQSLDFRAVEDGLNLWEQSSTGPVLEEFRANRAEYAQVVTDGRTTTEAKITDAAVAELDVRAGIARVLVGVDVKVRLETQAEPTLSRQRLQLEMTRTDQGWKASRVAPVR